MQIKNVKKYEKPRYAIALTSVLALGAMTACRVPGLQVEGDIAPVEERTTEISTEITTEITTENATEIITQTKVDESLASTELLVIMGEAEVVEPIE